MYLIHNTFCGRKIEWGRREESSVGLSKALSHKDSGLLDVAQCRLLGRPRRKD
jgi:hypothetical protein